MALNNSNLLKQGNSLKEVSESAYKDAMSTPGQQPSTAFGALSLGANQDQAKMIGSPAQKQKMARDNLTPTKSPVQPQQTLQQAQRITAQPEPQTDATQAKDKMDRLSQLGSMGMRLESMIQANLAEAKATQATTAVDQTKINALAPTMQQSAQQALQGYLTARAIGNQEEIQQSLKAVANSLGLAAVDEATINQYFTAQGTAGGLDQPQQVTLGQLDLAEMGGAEQIAADLGVSPEALANYSLEDFNKAIQDLESKEFNRVQELQAVLANPTSPQQQEAALRELRSLGYAGQTGLEQQFDTTQQQVRDAGEQSVLSLGGREFTIDDITKDKELSELINNVYADEATLNEWLNSDDPETRSIAEWIQSNKNLIKETQIQMGGEAKSFRDVQKSMDEYRSSIPAAFSDVLFEDEGFLTADEWAAKKEALDANTAIQALKANPSLQTMIDKSDLAWMQQLSTEEIEAQAQLTDKIADSLGLQALLEEDGIDGTKIVNPDDNEAVQSAIDKYEKWGNNDSLVTDKELMKAFEDGLISDSVRERLLKKPENRGAVMSVLKFKADVDDSFAEAMADNKIDNKEMRALLDKVGLSTLADDKNAIARLHLLASLGNSEAAKKVKLLNSFGIDKNGNVTNPAKFKEAIASGRSIDEAALSADSKSKYTEAQFSKVADYSWNVLADIREDGKWSTSEINTLKGMSDDVLNKFIKTVGIKSIPSDVLNKVLSKNFTNYINDPAFKNNSINQNGILTKDKNGNYVHTLAPLIPSGWRGNPTQVQKVADMLAKYDGQDKSAVISKTAEEFNSIIAQLEKDKARVNEMDDVPSSIVNNINKQIKDLERQRNGAISDLTNMLDSAVGPDGRISKAGLDEWQGALGRLGGNQYAKLDKVAQVNGMYPNGTNKLNMRPNPEAMKRYGVPASNPEKWLWEGTRSMLQKAFPGDSPAAIEDRLNEYFFKPPNGVAVISWQNATGKK